MQNKQPFSKDAIFEIATFCNPNQVFYNCARVNKLWYAAVQQDAYFYFALSRLNFFGDDLHGGIEFAARRKGDYFLYRTIQNWTCKQVFAATMQRIVLKQQQLLLAQQTLQEFKKENPHVKPLPRPASTHRRAYLQQPCNKFVMHPDSQMHALTIHLSCPRLDKNMGAMMSCVREKTFGLTFGAEEYQGMMHMYHKYMALSVKYPDLFLVPISYVNKIWFSHMSHPKMYSKYCKDLITKYGKMEYEQLYAQRNYLVPCSMYLTDMEMALAPEAWKQTQELWQKEFQEPLVPANAAATYVQDNEQLYIVSDDGEIVYKSEHYFNISFKMHETNMENYEMIYQATVLLNQFVKDHFTELGKVPLPAELPLTGTMVNHDMMLFKQILQFGIQSYEHASIVKSYERFLFIASKYQFVNPSAPIRFAWQAHMCNPVAYAQDMQRLLGTVLDFDSMEHDKIFKQNKLMQPMRDAWQIEYGCSMEMDFCYAQQ